MRVGLIIALAATCVALAIGRNTRHNDAVGEQTVLALRTRGEGPPEPSPATNRKSVRVRKSILTLTPQEKRDIVEAILKLKNTPSPYDKSLNYYDQFVQWHLFALSCPTGEHPDTPYPAHMGPGFFPWHRILLLLFEDALREVSKKEIALCYWDWTDPKASEAVFRDDFMGPNGDPMQDYAVISGPFRKGKWELSILPPKSDDPGQFRWLVRAFGTDSRAPSLPTRREVERALNIPQYDVPPWDITSDARKSFRSCLEGYWEFKGFVCKDGIERPVPDPPFSKTVLHNQVHLYVAGRFRPGQTMPRTPDWKPCSDCAVGTLNPATAPNDPAFWLHHAFIDKLWVDWCARHGNVYLPGTAKDRLALHDKIKPFANLVIQQDTPAEIADIIKKSTPAGVLDVANLGYRYDR
jgi:tyrosinase